jgi:transcriptional regulator with XRE-family HTH domain
VPFSAAAVLFDDERVTSPTDDSRGPTDKQIGRKLAAVREVMGFDVEALAARARLDVNLILAIEAGTHSANVDELSDLVFALGVTITAITQPVDPQTR